MTDSPLCLRPVIEQKWIDDGKSRSCNTPLPFQEQATAALSLVLSLRTSRQHVCIGANDGMPVREWLHSEVARLSNARPDLQRPFVHAPLADIPTLFGEFVRGSGDAPGFKPGLLALAGSGWLVLDARAILMEPDATALLERSLAARRILWRQAVGPLPGWVIPPDPAALDAQLLLIGDNADIIALEDQHPALMGWFGVRITLESSCPLDADHVPGLVACLEQVRIRAGVAPLTTQGWQNLLVWGCRISESSHRASLAIDHYLEVMREAHQWRAAPAWSDDSEPVAQALWLRRQAARALEGIIHRDVIEGASLAGAGEAMAGSVTALTLVEHQRHSVMIPARITATARQGDGKVIDIERESELGGSAHTKGVLILSAWLANALGSSRPLSLTAHIACEQCHDPIDGDSASAAELAALVSAIAQVPVAQHIAVTGAVSQLGDLMAVGGINEKIEGHFRLLRATGRLPCPGSEPAAEAVPGVIIPSANRMNLCLDTDLADAIDQGIYRIYPVSRVEAMLAILTGTPWEAESVAGESLRQKALSRLDNFDKSHRDDVGRSHWPRPLRDK